MAALNAVARVVLLRRSGGGGGTFMENRSQFGQDVLALLDQGPCCRGLRERAAIRRKMRREFDEV
jgi:hypothetical protein